MAELSRIRGADTEEQLLELQRAFLASEESRARPAARVQRVGGAPPRPPTADEAAGILSEAPTEIDPPAATAGASDPGPGDRETAPQLPTELRDVVTEVVERRVGGTAPKPPELRGPGVSFPQATHRAEGPFAGRKSKFMADREARRARAAAGDPSVLNPEVAPPGTVRVGNANVSFQMMPPKDATPTPKPEPRSDDAAGPAAPRRAFHPAAVADPAAGIDSETTRRLGEMSLEEIEEARATLRARLKPEALSFLEKRGRRRRDDDAGSGYGGPGGNREENAGAARVDAADAAGPRADPGAGAETFGGLTMSEANDFGPFPPRDTSGSATKHLAGSTGDGGAGPAATATEEVVAQSLKLTPPPPAPVETAAVRYTLDGTPLDVDELPAAQRTASRLGSAVERDPVRSAAMGVKPATPGYTVGESLDLARSSVPAQRVAGLNLLGRVLARAKRWGGAVSTSAATASTSGANAGAAPGGPSAAPGLGAAASPVRRRKSVGFAGAYGGFGAPSDPLSLPPPLPTGVAWQDVWLHATVDYDAVLTLRRCLDDDHMPAAAAAAAALSSLAGGADSGAGGVGAALRATAGSGPGGAGVGANGGANAIGSGVAVIDYIALANGATWWVDCVECAPPSRVAATGATAPVWRGGEPPEATFVPTTWTAATGPIVLRDDGTVPPDPADEEDQAEELGTGRAERSLSPEEKQEKRRARAMTRAADPIASLLRAGILPRLRWMLEVGKHPASVAPALALCAAAARHSAGGATAVARCPRMLDVLLTLAGGTGAAGVSTSYPPRGSAAAALRVIRLVAASASEHARRIGAEGVPAAAVRAAVSTGTPETSREAAGVWIETLRLWSATTAAGGATPSVDGLYPLIAPMLELPTATRGPEHASTAAGVAAEVFALLAAVVDAGGLSKPKRSVPENAETDAEAPHPSATLSMTETSSATMSWACAAGAAKAAEAWATATNPGARAAPAFAAGAPGAERSHSAWRAAGAAAHFLASLLTAVTRGSDAQASAAAVGAARRTLGLDEEEPAVSVRRLSGTESVRRLSATVAPVEEPAPPATNAPVLEPEEGLAAAALDALGSGSNDGTDGAFAARAAYGTALYGALRLVAATPGAASSPGALRLASRAVRQLTVSAAVCAAAIAAAIEDGAIRAGRAPLVAAAELPGQLALVVALELQDAADAAERRAASANTENDLAENDDVDGAVAAVEAVAALARALPPGAGRTALDALSAGMFSRRVLGPLLGVAATALDDAAEKTEAFESAAPDSDAAAAARRALAAVAGDAWCVSAARELQRSKASLEGARPSGDEAPTGIAAPPSRSLPSLEAARASLLGGFEVELLSRAETAKESKEEIQNVSGTNRKSAPPLVAVGSAIPLPPLPYWLLAPCSPKSSVAGWGAEGAAGALAMLLALEYSGSLVTRDLPADAKLASVSGTFCLGRDVWTHAGVAAAAATLTDLYQERLATELSSSVVNPRMGNSAYGFAGDARTESTASAHRANELSAKGGERDARAVSAARLAEALCEKFAIESFGDRLFARHVALQLRAGAPARARAAAWNALREGVAFHLLPPLAALAPRPERGDSLLFLPPGGERDPEMLELYLKALESGALDRCLLAALPNDGDGKKKSVVAPPLPAVLALHAATHAALGGGTRATATIRRVLSRVAEDGSGGLHPGARAALVGMVHTPLTQRRRPAVARAAAAGVRGAAGHAFEAQKPFGPGAAYGERAPESDVHARRTGLLAACVDHPELRARLREALDQSCL